MVDIPQVIGFFILLILIVVLYIVHFYKVSELDRKLNWGMWTIEAHTEKNKASEELQICYGGKVQMSLKKTLSPANPEMVGSNMFINQISAGTAGFNNLYTHTATQPSGPGIGIHGAKPGENKWGAIPCGSFF